MSNNVKKEGIEWIKSLVIAIGLAFIVRSFLFSSYVVSGESMMPTLENGNLLIVNKIKYDITDLQRFDVVVFHANKKEDYVKRVIGLPGDHIAYKDDVLYINGKPYQEPYLAKYKQQIKSGNLTDDFTLEEVTGGTSTVPEGKMFVIGDNRKGSYDSRYFGFVNIDQIVGQVNVRFWPVNEISTNFQGNR